MADYVLMGDPHLGRKFKTGVPLHRVGDREQMVWEQFHRNLLEHDAKMHICLGDLFDKFSVPAEVVLGAYNIYREVAEQKPDCQFIILRGNHDVSRDSSKKSSFDLFTTLVQDIPNITVINSVTQIDNKGFVPYCAFTPVEKQCDLLEDNLDVVFMHHDFTDFGGEHVIPTELLASKGITMVINGHDHLERVEKRHGVTVVIVGSLQPYTHAEDKQGNWYVTLELPIEQDVRFKNVRVLLKEGETLPEDLDCLSLTAKRVESLEEIELDTSDFDALDLRGMLARSLEGNLVKDQIMGAFKC